MLADLACDNPVLGTASGQCLLGIAEASACVAAQGSGFQCLEQGSALWGSVNCLGQCALPAAVEFWQLGMSFVCTPGVTPFPLVVVRSSHVGDSHAASCERNSQPSFGSSECRLADWDRSDCRAVTSRDPGQRTRAGHRSG